MGGVLNAVTVVVSVIAVIKLIQRQCAIFRERARGADDTPFSLSLLLSHVLFFVICIISSASFVPYFVVTCQRSFFATHCVIWWVIHTFSFMSLWGALVAIHAQRLYQVFVGTLFAVSERFPAKVTTVIILSLVFVAITLIGNAIGVGVFLRWFISVAVLGLLIASKIIAGAFITKFYRFNNRIAGTDLEGDSGPMVRMMMKSTIFAAVSLLSSVIIVFCTAIAVRVSLSSNSAADFRVAWYLAATAQSLDTLTNCVCIYLSTSIGDGHYEKICEPLHRRCYDGFFQWNRNRRRKRQTRAMSESKAPVTKEIELASRSEAPIELAVELQIEVVSKTKEKEVKLEEKEKEAEKDALAEMRRMSRRISCNLSVAHHFQQRTTTALNNVQNTTMERRSVPIGSTLQIGVGVRELTKSTDVMEVRGHRIEMDAEEDLAGQK